MINVLASVTVREGKRTEFIRIFKSNIPNVLKEIGCVSYVPTVDADTGISKQSLNGNVVTIIEKWDRLQDLTAHFSAPHMVTYGDKVKDLVENVELKILEEA